MKYYIGTKNIETNSLIFSRKPLQLFVKSEHIYALSNGFDFTILINEKNKYKFFISTISTILFEFELDINDIIDNIYFNYNINGYSNRLPYTTYIYIDYPCKLLIYTIFNKIILIFTISRFSTI